MPDEDESPEGRVSKDEQSAGTTLPRGEDCQWTPCLQPAQCLARDADCSLADRACGGERAIPQQIHPAEVAWLRLVPVAERWVRVQRIAVVSRGGGATAKSFDAIGVHFPEWG
jgi:hypothetical protein